MRTKTTRRIAQVLQAAVLLLLLGRISFSQTADLGENCDLRALGASNKQSFLAFDQELRTALSKHDGAMMALLVLFPLRINDDRGTYYLRDAHSLQLRLSEIFPSAVREAVLKQSPETVMCNSEGVMYGDGVLWISSQGKRFGIVTVNLPTISRTSKAPSSGAEFVCDADKHRVIVETGVDGTLRYRSWNKPRSLTESPDLEISGGKEGYEGSGSCRYRSWTFAKGTTTFVLQELGACDPDPPDGATGSLEVTTPGKPDVRWWCH